MGWQSALYPQAPPASKHGDARSTSAAKPPSAAGDQPAYQGTADANAVTTNALRAPGLLSH